jgi:phospholipid transport system substrate-binding protein
MDELERELKALREATDRVTASQPMKSELLLAVSRSSAATGAAAAAGSTKIVLMLVAAAAAGGFATWGLTHEPEEPAPVAAPAPAVNVNVIIGGAGTSAPVAVAPTPVPVAPLPVQVPSPREVPGPGPVRVVTPVTASADLGCMGIKPARTYAKIAGNIGTLPELDDRIAALRQDNGSRIVVARLELPSGKRPEDVIAAEPVTRAGWFAARVPREGASTWLVLPGYEPIGLQAGTDDDVGYAGKLRFTPLKESGELSVRVSAPGGDVQLSLTPNPCSSQTLAESPGRPMRNEIFRSLPLIPFRITARSQGATTAEVDVTPTNSRTEVELKLAPLSKGSSPPNGASSNADVLTSLKLLVSSVRYGKDLVALKLFAGDEQAKILCAGYWDKGTGSQHHEFIDLWLQLFAKIAFPKIRKTLENLDTILYDDPVVDGDKATVASTIRINDPLNKQELTVTYTLVRSSKGWLAVDASVMGDSMLKGIKDDQVQPQLQQGSWGRLLQAMHDKTVELK